MSTKDFWKRNISRSAVLSPVDRISEVLFGLIMVLTFTGAISAGSDGREEIRSLLWAALGCNVAWGLVDAIMYLMNVLFERGYSRNMLLKYRKSKPGPEATAVLKNELPAVFSELMDEHQLATLDRKLRDLPEPAVTTLLTTRDLLSALRIFLLVFLCTLPVSLPFGFFHDSVLALRVSNGVALVLLFCGGYQLARNAGFRPIITALAYMFIGVVLVAITMALGG
jgi:hypothetical protein